MKKILAFGILTLACISSIFAGDVAEYCDLGFSQDGKYFTFAQYGVKDKTFEPFAEIYCVDVQKNDYVENGVFKAKPDLAKSVKGGKAVFDELYAKNENFIKNYSGKKANLEQTLYIRGPETKNSSDQIVFKDFNNSTEDNEIFYYINLVKNIQKGKNLSSSFFISVDRKDEKGNVISRQVAGNPDFMRKNISDYSIRRIITDESGKYLIFEVEKKLEDESGTSFRYMVETLELK